MSSRRSSGLTNYAVRRAVQAVPLILSVLALNFMLIQLAPGNPIAALTGDFPATPEYVERMKENLGLNEPPWKQFVLYIKALAQGDFGYSFANQQPVLSLIADRALNTLALMGVAMIFAISVGIPLGLLSARKPGSTVDNITSSIGLAGYAMPVFWLGQLLIVAFALKLAILPAGGMTSLREPPDGFERVTEFVKHLILPALTLSFRYIALYVRITRASMMETLNADYIITARVKGLSRHVVETRHALRNAMLPIVTVVGYELGFIVSGSVLVETVFSWPGIGSLLFSSITARDTPVILGIFVAISAVVIVVNLLTDVLYAWLDPRIRYGKGS